MNLAPLRVPEERLLIAQRFSAGDAEDKIESRRDG